MSKPEAKKFSISMREDLLQKVDDYASNNGMTRSGLMSLAVSKYLQTAEAMPSVNKLLNGYAAIMDSALKGDMDPVDARARLDAIQAFYTELSKKTPKYEE